MGFHKFLKSFRKTRKKLSLKTTSSEGGSMIIAKLMKLNEFHWNF